MATPRAPTEFEQTLGWTEDVDPTALPVMDEAELPEHAADFGGDPERFRADWDARLAAAQEHQRDWVNQAKSAWRRYTNRKSQGTNWDQLVQTSAPETYNLFYSTVETIKPLVYQLPPVPVVRRRVRQKGEDPNQRAAAETMQRALQYVIDSADSRFHEVMLRARDSGIVAGRGVVEVDYEAIASGPSTKPTPVHFDSTMQRWKRPDGKFLAEAEVHPADPDADGDDPRSQPHAFLPALQRARHERVRVRYQNPFNVVYPDCEDWGDLPWMAVLEFPTREEIEGRFGVATADLLQWTTRGASGGGGDLSDRRDQDGHAAERDRQPQDGESRARVWRIFDLSRRRVILLEDQGGGTGGAGWSQNTTASGASSDDDSFHGVIDIIEDEFNFPEFYPFVRPFQTIESEECILPVPEYVQVRSQLDEMDAITERCRHFRQALTVCAITSAVDMDLASRIFDDTSKPKIVSTSGVMPQGTKMEDMFAFVPNDQTVGVLTALYRQREDVKAEVFEITGISDIMRGHSQASETARAQEIKLSSGSRRTKDREVRFNEMVKEVLRRIAHVIATKFADETLIRIGGMEMRTQEGLLQELIQLNQKAPEAMMQAQNGDDSMWKELRGDFEKLKTQPTRERTMAILRDQFTRDYTIDVETHSTIVETEQEHKQQAVELLEGVTHMTQAFGPLVQVGVVAPELFQELLKITLRHFNGSRQLEMVLEQHDPEFSALGLTAGDEAAQAQDAQAALAAQQAESQLEVERMRDTRERDLKQMEGQQQMQVKQLEAEVQKEANQQQAELKAQELQAKIQMEREKLFLQIQQGQQQMQMQQQQSEMEMAQQQQQGQMDMQMQERQMAMQEQQSQQQMQMQQQQGNQQMQLEQQKAQQAAAMPQQPAAPQQPGGAQPPQQPQGGQPQ